LGTLAVSAGLVVAAGGAETYEGIVRPSRVVTLKAPLEERLAELLVSEAQRVETGQALARMASEEQEAIVDLVRSRAENTTPVEIAELALEDAEVRYQRLKKAYESDAANELEVVSSRIARDRAGAELRAARRERDEAVLRLDLERVRLERHAVVAPFAGVVSEVMTEAGASLTREDPMLELMALDPLEASFDLPDVTYGWLSVGDEVTVSAEAPLARELAAVVDRVVPRLDPGSRTYRVVLRIENAGQVLPSGFVVELHRETAGGDEGAGAGQ
jgi:RND family efflux transporter MFP subunit